MDFPSFQTFRPRLAPRLCALVVLTMAGSMPAGAQTCLAGVLKHAAAATGTSYAFLADTAMRESSLDPQAKAASSSAVGLYQFTEQTWLKAIHQFGAEHGLAAEAEAIRVIAGRAIVDGPRRAEILALRYDPKLSAIMAGALAQQNLKILQKRIGREPNGRELYLAHFLGPAGAARLIDLARRNDETPAADYFVEAAKANPDIFGRGARRLSAGQVYEKIVGVTVAVSDAASQTATHRDAGVVLTGLTKSCDASGGVP